MSISIIMAFLVGFFIGGQFAFIITCLIMAGRDEDF